MENPDLQRTNLEPSAPTPLSFLFYLLEPDVRRKTIAEALEARAGVPLDLRNGLDRAINNCASVPGFRTAGRAPVGRLVAILDDAIQHSAELAVATARVWFCGQENLREAATEALEKEGALEDPHTAPAEMVWVGYPSDRVSEAFRFYSEAHSDEDLGQATLMFQLLTGLSDVNGDPEEGDVAPVSKLLATTLQALDTLPSNCPEWEASLPEFAADLAKLIERKQEEGRLLRPLYEFLDTLEQEHGPIIEFFQWNLSAWDVENLGSEKEIRRAHDKAEELRGLLSRYAPIHERAAVATVELTRAAQRMELFPLIIDTGSALQRILSGEDQSGGEDDQDSGEDSEPACKDKPPVLAAVIAEESGEGNAGMSNRAPNEQSEGLGLEVALALGLELESEPAGQDSHVPGCDIEDYLLLRLANQDLEQENDDLELENAALKEQIKALEHRLYESRNQEEGWRLALVHQENLVGEEHVPVPENVSAAVQMAQERFPSQLLFQLNADSRVEDCPFKWPEQVWRALEWLATGYYDSRSGCSTVPDMDEACRRACGMWYKTGQHDNTMTQYRNSYTTKVDGRLIWLGEHIGKGISFDPRRTIRIGFDWDRRLQKVVIGYIGQHQRTAAT